MKDETFEQVLTKAIDHFTNPLEVQTIQFMPHTTKDES